MAAWPGVANKGKSMNVPKVNSRIEVDRTVLGKEAEARVQDDNGKAIANRSNEQVFPSTSREEEPVTLKDAFGRTFTFPWSLSKTWKVLMLIR